MNFSPLRSVKTSNVEGFSALSDLSGMRTGVSATIEQAISFLANQVLNVVVRQAGMTFTERCSGGVEQLGIVNAGVLWGGGVGVGVGGIGGHICAFHWLRGLLSRAFAAPTITATAICTVCH